MPAFDPSAEEALLIEAAQRGEAAAFQQLFHRSYSMIHAFAYRLCLRAADADDIAQETFIQAARNLGSFRGGNFQGWLFRIAANRAHDLHREQVRRQRLGGEALHQAESGRQVRSAEEPLEEALLALPLEQREAVILVYLEGLSHAEAARVAGCAEATVSWRLMRARRRLKQLLSPSA